MSAGYGGAPGSVGSGRTPGQATPAPGGAPADLVTVTVVTVVNGQDCTYTAAVTPAQRTQQLLTTIAAVAGPINGPLSACPAQVGTAGPRVAPVSPAKLAERFWYRVALPTPRPSSRPDYATTGKLTYLTTGDTNAPPSWHDATPLGDLTITAHGTYNVSWGDGTTTGPYATPGAPYPTGTVTHTYDTIGRVTITAQETWTATWNIGKIHGTLTDLHTTGTLPNFPVRQIQAVITG